MIWLIPAYYLVAISYVLSQQGYGEVLTMTNKLILLWPLLLPAAWGIYDAIRMKWNRRNK